MFDEHLTIEAGTNQRILYRKSSRSRRFACKGDSEGRTTGTTSFLSTLNDHIRC